MSHILVTEGLTKRFGRFAAVDGLSINVPERSIYGFLGANGAGKTTTLRLALGLLRPDSGRIELLGRPLSRGGARSVGALIETPSLYPHLTGRENLDLTRRLLKLPSSEIDRVFELVDLAGAARKRVGGYSLGMRQRLAIARSLLGRPELLILDEPTNGLDPEGIVDMRAMIRRLPDAEGTTLIVSSHLLAEIEQVASHIAILHRGRLLVENKLSDLLSEAPSVELDTADRAAAAQLLLVSGYRVRVEAAGPLVIEGESRPERIAQLLVAEGHSLRHLARRRPSLERVYHSQLALAA